MKELAFKALEVAVAIFPPLARLLYDALSSVPSDHPDRPLVDEVLEILPAHASIHDAVAELEERQRRGG